MYRLAACCASWIFICRLAMVICLCPVASWFSVCRMLFRIVFSVFMIVVRAGMVVVIGVFCL